MGKKLVMVFWGSICSYVINVRIISYRKANNLFEKNAAPILHLSGVEITIVKVCSPTHAQINTHICLCNNIIDFFSRLTDRLWRSGKETDGSNGADRHVDCCWRRWHLAGSHHWITEEARSSRVLQSHHFLIYSRTQRGQLHLSISLMDVFLWQDKMSNIPIGFIPLGSSNSLSPSLHLLSDNKVK